MACLRRPSAGWHRRLPMRFMLIVVIVAVAMLLDFRVSQATQMPWCAGTTKVDFFSYNCTLPTYEMCVQEVIAGNRGFCGPNPYYRGPELVPSVIEPSWRQFHWREFLYQPNGSKTAGAATRTCPEG